VPGFGRRKSTPFVVAVACLAALTTALCPPVLAGPLTQARVISAESIKPVPSTMLVSGAVASDDLNRRLQFMVPLKMRNYDELLARIHQGEVVSSAEMSAKYYPLESDYVSVLNWLTSEGFAIEKKDRHHLGIVASGSVNDIQRALQVSFGRVNHENKTYISATTAPSVPVAIMPAILGINGLQPHIQRHKHSRLLNATPAAVGSNQPPFTPSQILAAYNAGGATVNGAGQTIGIVIDAFPKSTDLTSFWSRCGISQSLSNMQFVQVGGSLPAASGEETLDSEWTSGIASGAKVRIYASGDLSDINLDQCYQKILDDLPTNPGLRQISLSYGIGELDESVSQMQSDAQYFASMAANGVTVFVSSGDGGSSPDSNGGHNGPTQVENPAADPSVTAVGGTSIFLNSSGTMSSESAWYDGGGGVSTIFSRPTWQTGAGVTSGTKRLVPDVAAPADPSTGALVILNGTQHQYGGTSWSAPIWAGLCALINQARANAGMPTVGLLGPKIYPLLGGANFSDITTGNNGGYSAGSGFDLCTGVGTPKVAALVQALSNGSGGGSNPQPNLVPYQPSGWSDKIVVSNVPGTTTDGNNFQPTDTLYVDWAVTNSGAAATAARFYAELYVDGNLTQTWAVDPPLAPNSSTNITDFSIGNLSGGMHDIRIKMDSTSAIAESSETDNDYTKTISVGWNDDFANRQVISGSTGSVNGSNVGATEESGEPYHAGNVGGSSIWYSWTAPGSGPATFDTFQSTFDTLLAVYTGSSMSSLNLVASDDDSGSVLQSRVSFNAVGGVTYQIAIDGYGGDTGNTVLHWALTQQTYLISLSSSPAAGGSATGAGNYASGSSATVSATPASGYTFSRWTENGSVVSTSASYAFTVNGSRTLVANFSAAQSNYTIATTASPANGGTTSGVGTFASGSSHTVTATANSGFTFVNWTENGSVVSNSAGYTFTLTGNRNLVANFASAATTYTITLGTSPFGKGTVSGAGSFPAGGSRTVTAVPNRRFAFRNWSENGVIVSYSSTYAFPLTGNRNLTANFARRR
jgi:kumamolisin